MRFSRNRTESHDLTGDQYKMMNSAGKESVCSSKKKPQKTNYFPCKKLWSSLKGSVIAKNH